jgi:exopolyphosphatase/guanosine-5'-triphosphate,3'-diphosphate pyrophosphatase
MGTNSFHMIVCQATEEKDHFEIVMKVKESVPFFRRALTAHYIDNSAMSAAIAILRDMKNKANNKGAKHIIAVATSAVREANNGEEVLDKIRQELNIDAKMISGREEARLIYLGVLWSMPNLKGNFSIVDIGGGSTEIIVSDRSNIKYAESYKLGAARLTQRFFRKEYPTEQEIRELHDEIRGVLRPASAAIAEYGFSQLIGTSGTIQTLAKLDRIFNKKTHVDSHGYKLSLTNLEDIVSELEEVFIAGDKLKEVSSDRNRTILAGAIVLLEIMRSLKASNITVCTAALREGIAVDRFLQTGWLKGALEHHQNPRSANVHALLEKYDASVEHAEQVARIASEIFLKTRTYLHNYPDDYMYLLWSSAMLHDVGMFIGRNGHHKHSYYLIKHGGLIGHSEEEVNVIAGIARYHRGSEPKESHEAYNTLLPSQKKMVTDMAAILRLAEALDRSHRQVVQRIEFDFESNSKSKDNKVPISLLIYVKPGESWEPETWALKEKKSLFEKQFQVRLGFEVRVESRSRLSAK